MKCNSCKRAIPENSIYCNWCGTRQLEDDVKVPAPRQRGKSWWIYLDKEKRSITAPTAEECRQQAVAIRKGQASGMTVAKAYAEYIEDKAGVLSPSTLAGYRRLAKNTMQELMPLSLDSITAPQIQRAVNNMAKECSPKYVRNAYGLLTAVFSLYRPDFSPRITLPQKIKTPPRALNEGEIKAIMQAVKGTDIELPILCGLWLGMRLSEILAATAEDIHDGRLHIHKALVTDYDGKAVEKTTKTEAGDRYIPMPDYILSLVPPSGPFTTLSGQAIYKRFSRLCEASGIRHCRIHDLRHANAAVMLTLGVDSATAQARNGWSSDHMYRQVYGYSTTEAGRAAAENMNKFFDRFLIEF